MGLCFQAWVADPHKLCCLGLVTVQSTLISLREPSAQLKCSLW